MKIRLEGLPAELDAATDAIARVLVVVEVSRDYPNRPPSLLARRYLTTHQVPAAPGGPTAREALRD